MALKATAEKAIAPRPSHVKAPPLLGVRSSHGVAAATKAPSASSQARVNGE